MNNLSLKQVLAMESVQADIASSLFGSKEEMEVAIAETLKSSKENGVSVKAISCENNVNFENTLHVDEDKHQYLLESRIFSESNEQMMNAYLCILDADGTIKQDHVDDVWSYANWQEVN